MLTKTTKKIVTVLESNETPWVNYMFTFFFAIILRLFFETFSQPVNNFYHPTDLLLITLIHYTLSYLMLALMFIGFFSYAWKESFNQVSRIIFPGFIILLVGPLLDLMISRGQSTPIFYIQPSMNDKLFSIYLSFFSAGFYGASFGIKIEIVLALFLIFTYCRIKNQSAIKSLFLTWVGYSLIFLLIASPCFIRYVLHLIYFDYQYSDQLMTRFFLLAIPLVSLPLLYVANKNIFYLLLRNFLYLRLWYYELMFMVGIVIICARHDLFILTNLLQHQSIVIYVILSLMSIFFACFFCALINRMNDTEMNIISTYKRPLFEDKLNVFHYKILAYFSLFVSFFYAAMVSIHTLLIIMVMISGEYLCSMPPLRLKYVPMASKIVIAVNSFALMFMGYLMVMSTFSGFPNVTGLFWLIVPKQ